jgi:hypothetical protein
MVQEKEEEKKGNKEERGGKKEKKGKRGKGKEMKKGKINGKIPRSGTNFYDRTSRLYAI